MKEAIALIITATLSFLLLASCSRKVYPTQNVHDSIYVERERIVTDTIVQYVPQAEEHSVITDSISHLETSLAMSDAKIIEGKLYHSLSNKIEPIPVSVPLVIEREYKFSGKVLENTIIVEREKELKWYQQCLIRVGIFALCALFLLVGYKLFSGKIKSFIEKIFR